MGFFLVITNGIYILFCLFVSKIVTVLLKEDLAVKMDKNALYLFVFMFFLLLPFWDLVLQKGIKTYYQVFLSTPTIYAYPEKDNNGKFESIYINKIAKKFSSDYLIDRSYINLFNDYNTNSFLEIYMFDSFTKEIVDNKEVINRDYKNDMGYVRVYLNQDESKYELIKDESEFRARYQILAEEINFYLFQRISVKIWDKEKNILLGEGSELKFGARDKERFRYKFLFWRTGNDSDLVRVKSVDNYNLLFKELFGNKLIKYKEIMGEKELKWKKI